jgi:serine/threonine protein kinase
MSQTAIERIEKGESLGDVLEGANEKTHIDDIIDVIRVWLAKCPEIYVSKGGVGRNALDHINNIVPAHLAGHPDIQEAVLHEEMQRMHTTFFEQINERKLFGPTNSADGKPRYELIEIIGGGSQSEVWSAIDRQNQYGDRGHVAIKKYEPQIDKSSLPTSSTNHPNVAQLFDTGSYNGRYYQVYQYIQGPTLDEWKRGNDLQSDEIIDVMLEICDGMTDIHGAGIFHRDLKPTNIVMSGDTPVIIDFGISVTRESVHRPAGTPQFMAPEQIHPNADRVQVDIYGIGAVMYWMLTGEAPNGDTAKEALERFENKRAADLTQIQDIRLRRVLMRAMSFYPKDRFASVTELRTELFAIRKNVSTEINPNTIGVAKRLLKPTNLLSVPLVTVTAILISIVIAVMWYQSSESVKSHIEVLETSQKYLAMATEGSFVGDGTDPAYWWMLTQQVGQHGSFFETSARTVLENKGISLHQDRIAAMTDDPSVSRLTLAFQMLMYAHMINEQRAYTRPTNSDSYGRTYTVTQTDVQKAYIGAQEMFREALGSGLGEDDPLFAKVQGIVESSLSSN